MRLAGLEHSASEAAASAEAATATGEAAASTEAAHAASEAAHASTEAAHTATATHALTCVTVTEYRQTVGEGCHEVAGDILALCIST